MKFNRLTRAAMRRLPRGGRMQEHGVEFERLENGDGRFSVSVQIDGERVRRRLGLESQGVTRETAERFIEQARTDARHERLNLPKRRKIALRFSEAAARYLERLEASGGKDIPRKRNRLELHLVPFFRDFALDKLTPFDLQRYVKQRRGEGASPATINRELAALSHLMHQAQEWKWISTRPRIRRLQEPPGRTVYLTTEQAARLLDAARKSDAPFLWLFVTIGLETSMRRSNILGIRLADIDMERRIIKIAKAKGFPEGREQPITAHLADVLRQELEKAATGQEWLFPSLRSESGHLEWPDASWRRAVRAAGLDPKAVTPHTMRHTAVSHLTQAGADLPTIQAVSGHKTASMVWRYSHTNPERIGAALDQLQSRVSGSQNSRPTAPKLHHAEG